MRGIDCSTRVTPQYAKHLKEKGFDFVIRYILPQAWKSWKAITKQELIDIRSADLQLGFVFQRTRDRVKLGKLAGSEDGKLAIQSLKELGISEGVTIYFAVDYEAPKSDYDEISAYLRAVAEELTPSFKVGVYGCYDVVEYMYNNKVVTHTWQTLAWSRGKLFKNVNVYQSAIDKPLDNILKNFNVDFNTGYGNEGFLGQQVAEVKPKPTPKPAPKKSVPESKPKAKTKPKEINGIEVVGEIKVENLRNFTYIYDRPTSSSKQLGVARKGEVFPIAGSVPKWYEIIYQGRRAYIFSQYGNRV